MDTPLDVQAISTALQHSKCLADALHCHVCWARVKGYPYWPVSRDSMRDTRIGGQERGVWSAHEFR